MKESDLAAADLEDLPPTMADSRRPPGMAQDVADLSAAEPPGNRDLSRPVGNFFAQDLLVQEQQSKARLTADLLMSQRKLEEEQHAAETLGRELRKVRQQVEEERAKRQEAEDSRDRLSSEVEGLRSESRQLQELSSAHDELRQQHKVAEKDLSVRAERCQVLDEQHSQLRRDLAVATAAQQKASQQQAELQIRARQAQERAERLEQQHAEAEREAEKAVEEGSRLQRELATETAQRVKLQELVTASKEQVSHAEGTERATREQLDVATSRRAELECQAAAAQSEAESAKAAAMQAQQRLASSRKLGEQLRVAGRGVSVELRRRAELWDRALSAEGPEVSLRLGLCRLDEALLDVEPTFAQATCRVVTPTKSQHGDTDVVRVAASEEPGNGVGKVRWEASTAHPSCPRAEVQANLVSAEVEACGQVVAQATMVAEGVPSAAPTATGLPESVRADRSSTAWSLEVLELVDPVLACNKRPKRTHP
ncbi:unnamed protein product [Polarella glacialis]|uniref:Uncharacterized protein n=1 Tax=Polarella glacialis TaxID=89957 RepID=A0A813G8L1_POLGL|nr:unnamed protein product [Polarella glacialis]